MSKSALRVMHENDVETYKKWLRETLPPINVERGLSEILFNLNPLYSLKKMQIIHLGDKLARNMRFARSSFSFEDSCLKLDEIVTLISNLNTPGMLGSTIRSRPQFVKLIYQCMSCLPSALLDAHKEITGESLILDDLSVVREFYESCSQFDLWTGHEFCAYISHCDPEALDFMLENPKKPLPERLSRIFSRPDLYEKNVPLVKAAIFGGAFELIHFHRDNWVKSSLKPKKGLEWAKKKGIEYHPVLDELLLTVNTTHEISSGYTTPYLEIMQDVIRELGISKENQGKKEAIAALFEKKLADHKATPSSQKLADAMATLVRLPESQQGRAKTKG